MQVAAIGLLKLVDAGDNIRPLGRIPCRPIGIDLSQDGYGCGLVGTSAVCSIILFELRQYFLCLLKRGIRQAKFYFYWL